MAKLAIHPIIRARQFIDFNGPDGCWIWTGSKSRTGYGNFHLSQVAHGRKMSRAHRFIYLFLTGQSGEGLVCDHLCKNRACVNPNHIELVGSVENIKRGNAGIRQKEKTACPRGHAYSEENTIYTKEGYRRCRVCNRVWAKKNRQKQ